MKTVADKLLIKPGTSLWMSDREHLGRLGPLPIGIQQAGALGDATVALVFGQHEQSVRDLLTAHRDELSVPAVLWVCYPKGNKADINRDTLWPILTEFGLRPISQVAVDETWSALRFRPLNPDEAPFKGGKS